MRVLACLDNDSRYEDVLVALERFLPLGSDDEVVLAHVVSTLRWMPRQSDADPGWSGVERAILDRAGEFLEQTAERIATVPTRQLLAEGDIVEEIVKATSEHDVDVIVLGAIGQARSSDFLVGSVAEKLGLASEKNLLLVRDTALADDGSFRVLLAVDGSPGSLAAVEGFAKFIDTANAEIRLVHVLELPPATWDLNIDPSGPRPASVPPWAEERAERALAEGVAALEKRGLEVSSEIRRGAAASELLEAVRLYEPALVVVGAGEGGSVARRVVRHAPASAFVVYPEKV